MTSPPAISNETVNFEITGRLYVENEQNKQRIKELEAEKNDAEKYKQRYRDKCEECDDWKEKYKLLEEKYKLIEQHGNGISHSKFQYIFDTIDFNERMDISDIEHLMDICMELVETKLPKGYLIETSMDIVPIYVLLAERDTFRKHGNSDADSRNWGITPFCDCWNNNIVPRISDGKRREELLCDSGKIKSALSKELWKESASCSWNRLYDSCDNSNGRNAKKKAKLGRAINIKMRLEKLLEQIPALKSKKY